MNKDLAVISKTLRINQTPWEIKVWRYLRGNRLGLKFKRQVPMGKYVVDFCCQEKRLIIELDGGHHNEPEIARLDTEKENYLESRGYKVLRFWNNDIDSNFEGVMDLIKQYV